MKFNALILNIFTNTVNDNEFRLRDKTKPHFHNLLDLYKSICFYLKTGCKWEDIKCYSNYHYSTAYKYFKIWTNNGLFKNIYNRLLNIYVRTNRIDLTHQAIDSTTIKVFRGGNCKGRNPTDRGRNGCKLHSLTDGNGIPLAYFTELCSE